MATTATSLDNTTHPVNAIILMSDFKRVKFPKVKPTGTADANDAAWQTRAQAEHVAAVNNAMATGAPNATSNLANLA